MKKLLLLALLLMPTMTLARESIDLPAQAITEPIYAPIVEPTPSVAPSMGGAYVDHSPKLTSTISKQESVYNFLTGDFGFAYFERLDGTRVYEMDYATYHTIKTDGKGTIYFVQIDANGYEHKALKVLDIN